MTNSEPVKPIRIVVFDLGGVLVRICRTIEDASRNAAVQLAKIRDEATPFTSLPAFDAYQGGLIGEDEYLSALGELAGCAPEQARDVHNHILVDPYPGTEALIEELHVQGVVTGCLSNTNALHWTDLVDSNRFPAIASLGRKMASHLVGLSKPDPEIYRRYAMDNEVAPEEIVFFDDDARNVASAQEVGFRALHIDPTGDTAAQMRGFLAEQGVL